MNDGFSILHIMDVRSHPLVSQYMICVKQISLQLIFFFGKTSERELNNQSSRILVEYDFPCLGT